MKHITDNEIIDFVSMTDLNESSLKNASVVTGHIAECESCLQRVKAYQTLFDEFVRLGRKDEAKEELYKIMGGSQMNGFDLLPGIRMDYNK